VKKQTNKAAWPIVIVFLVFIGAMGILSVILPKRTFSETENRYLKKFPEFSMDALLHKGWTTEFEEYVTDHFAFRDPWIGLKAVTEYTLGKRENNGNYLGKNGYLLQDYASPKQDALIRSIGHINRFAQNASVPVYTAIVPGSIYVNRDKLPPFSLESDQSVDLETIKNTLVPEANYIDLLPTMLEHREEELYYRTDHHWTSLGAYYAYEEIMSQMGQQAFAQEDFDRPILSENFYGTLQAAAGTWWIEPDTITGYAPKTENEVSVEIYEGEELEKTLDGYWAMDRLQTRDQYSTFLDGNHARVVIKTGNPGKKLLLIKDSFGHSLAPILSANYSQIDMVDLRYYKVDYEKYMQENQIDECLILYSIDNFVTDTNLVFLNYKS